jgi:hypothetical protein
MAKASKGGSFEREICKFLTAWCGGDPKHPYFWRQPASGAMLTRNDDINMSGDIRAIRPEGDFLTKYISLELKNGYPKTSIDYHLKYNKSDGIREFWEQCVGDARKVNKHPMLIYRKKGINPIFIGMGLQLYQTFGDYLQASRFIHLGYTEDYIPDLYMFGITDFFNNITPKILETELC